MKKLLTAACMVALICACNQKQNVVSVPVTQIDVEKLIDSIDYDMDVSSLSLADVRILSYAPTAKWGFPFKDAYIRGIYSTTTWYDSLMWKLDSDLPWDKYPSKEDENWEDHYYRVIKESGYMKLTEQEQAFIKRMEEREKELQKQNFEVPTGLRVNMQNLANPRQLADFDSLLAQRLGEDGFAIVPSNNEQLFTMSRTTIRNSPTS